MKNFFRILFLVLCPVLAFGQGTHTGGGGSGGGGLTQVASLPGICAAGAQYQLPNGDIYTCGPLNVLTKTGNGLTDGVALRGLMAEYRILPTETVAALVDYSGNGRNATGTVGTAPTIIAVTGGISCIGTGAVSLPASLNTALTVEIFASFQSTGITGSRQALVQGSGANYIQFALYSSLVNDAWATPIQGGYRLRSDAAGTDIGGFQ